MDVFLVGSHPRRDLNLDGHHVGFVSIES